MAGSKGKKKGKNSSGSAKPSANPQVNSMWGGQFAQAPDALLAKINVSVDFDKKLWQQDIQGSIAHAKMLAKQKIISEADAKKIVDGLKKIEAEIRTDGFIHFKDSLEDVHMNIESRLKELIGEPAGRLHTARSRNDQVATDLRLYVRDALGQLNGSLVYLQEALLKRAEEHAATLMPGFTHLQVAQPITLGHHLLAYAEMFERDRKRVKDARKRLNESPLGAAALAGTSFPIDRKFTATELGFEEPMANSLDAVASRDFALEFLSVAAICAVHLSRLAEELILWSSAQFGFIRFSDAWSTGSSIMPQKRNPDAAELVRGKSGRMFGNLMSLLTTMKALPLAYNKDMQEDKEPVFDTAENILVCVDAMYGMVGDFTVHKEQMEAAAGEAYANATDLADWLVKELKLPFREAHHATAQMVKLATQKKKPLEALTLKELQSVEPRVRQEVFGVLSPANSVKSRTSFGGTSPANVKKAIVEARKRYLP